MRRIGLLIVVLVGNLAFAQSSGDPATLYANADTVFVGELQKIIPSSTGLTVQFKFDQFIKGRGSTDKVLQADFPVVSRCHKLEQLHSYLVYARTFAEHLWVDPCDGSKLVSQAEVDLRYIHTINPKISERCNRTRLDQLAAKSPIVATAEVIETEDSLRGKDVLVYRPWCGLTLSTEDAHYAVHDVLKGQIPDSKIVVEHLICLNTVTVNGYSPTLSPELFREGNVLLLFLKAGSSDPNKHVSPPFNSVYADVDEDCGAVMADGDAALGVADFLRTHH